MKKTSIPPPTDAEILAHGTNVPASVAARYLGIAVNTLYYALQDERAPFGFAIRSPLGTWAYQISPEALVKYKHGDLPIWRLKELQDAVSLAVAAKVKEVVYDD